ncbi:MAG: helix-turn-helix domain-containing protein [bacterium]
MKIIESEFVGTKEVAKYLCINPMTIYRAIKNKELNSYKIGNKFRIKLSDVEEYLKRKQTGGDKGDI